MFRYLNHLIRLHEHIYIMIFYLLLLIQNMYSMIMKSTETKQLQINPLIIDYIQTRFFNGFNLVIEKEKILLKTTDSTVIALLEAAKIIKSTEDENLSIDVGLLLPKKSAIKKTIRDHRWQWESECTDLLDALTAIQAFSDPEVKERLNSGNAQYGDLPVLYTKGTEVVAATPSGLLGGIIDSCVEQTSMFGNYYRIGMLVILPTSKGCSLGKVYHKVPDFGNSIVAIEKLSVRPVTTTEKATLSLRGEQFRDFTKDPAPATYSGNLTMMGWTREYVLSASGRVMVDSLNFALADPDAYHELMRSFEIDDDSPTGVVKDEDLWRCYNRIHGFSMRVKKWGWLNVQGIQKIEWRDDALENLVLPEKQKSSVHHLVKHYGNSFSDFIDGKSGGLVFLLHGSTGVGKTLTAEAVAETLHRPLYSVSVGELGVKPDELEENLRNILNLAAQWNAVLLLDEADIFMEARDTNNIDRNAMVSIFLRLLEYYSGVLFLTTNRVKIFDPAFFSRISLAISYPKLDAENREMIWRNITSTAGIPLKLDYKKLASYEVNGRNIKNIVRIAQTMALGTNRSISQKDIEDILSMTEDFNEIMKG